MKIHACVLGIGLAVCQIQTARAQALELPRLSPSAKVTQTVGLTEITVDYSSPGLRGRKVCLRKLGRLLRGGCSPHAAVSASAATPNA